MCTLRASGTDFDVDAFLAESPIEVSAVYRRGEPTRDSRPDGPRHDGSGFNAGVSDAEWDDLEGQIRDAETYLSENEAEIRRLRTFAGVDGVELDFPVEIRTDIFVFVQSKRFPPRLLRMVGALDIELCLSTYPTGPDDEDKLESDEEPA